MNATISRWLVTIRLDECRTMDVGHDARSAWAAGWLHRQLHPQDRIIAIRKGR